MLKEMNIDTKETNRIIRKLYKFSNDYPQTMFKDEAWQGVKKFYSDLIKSFQEYLDDSSIGAGEYFNYFSESPRREYKVRLKLNNGKTIDGIIQCNAAGTKEDPFSMYDITTSWWKAEENPMISESRLKEIIRESIEKVLKKK